MTVVAGWFAGRLWNVMPGLADLPPALQAEVQMGSALNSKARGAAACLSSMPCLRCPTPGFPDCMTARFEHLAMRQSWQALGYEAIMGALLYGGLFQGVQGMIIKGSSKALDPKPPL